MTAGTRTSTKERFLVVAADLFLRQGYEKTPVAQILEKTGVGAGSFYYHFDSKEGLLLAVLDRYRRLLPEIFERPAYRATEDPIARVFHILELYRRYLLEFQFDQGCPVGNIALEIGDQIPAARQRTDALFEQWRAMIRRCLDDAADRFSADLNRDELATLVLTVMEGGVMQSRAARDIGPFEASVRQLRNYFDLLTSRPAVV